MVATNYLSEQTNSNSITNKKAITIGYKIRAALWHAQIGKRLITGLSAAVKMLSKTPDECLFCILAPAQIGDTSTHMQAVLLEAYCYENDIYIIKVDSAEKLTRILGTRSIEPCVLIQKSMIMNAAAAGTINTEHLTLVENELVDYCEELWDVPGKAAAVALP